MTHIPLTQGKVAIVDDADAESVLRFKWHAIHVGRRWYAGTNTRDFAGRYLHRFLMRPSCGTEVCDHIDHDGLNNRRSNLRITTLRLNIINAPKKKNNKSGLKGVHWSKDRQKWVASIGVERRVIPLGRFDDKQEAFEAYCAAAKKYHGEFACCE